MSTLLLGQTDYFSEKDLLSVFSDRKVIVIGDLARPSRKIRQLKLTDVISLNTIFRSYNIQEVVYFSSFVNSINSGQDEFYQLERLLESLISEPHINLIYVTGPDLNYKTDSYRHIVSQAAESLCLFYKRSHQLNLKIVRSLHLYNSDKVDDVLGVMIQPEAVEANLPFKINPKQPAYFICPLDIITLLHRIFDNWDENETELISVATAFDYDFATLASNLIISDTKKEQLFDENAPIHHLQTIDSKLHQLYGWFPKISLLDDLPIARAKTTTVIAPKANFIEFIYRLSEQKLYMKILQVFAFFAISESMSSVLGQELYFRMIDYRLLFVSLVGLIFGTAYGLLAATLASIGLVTATILAGTSFSSLFFEPLNWVTYIAYFIISTFSGSIRDRARDEVETLNAENDSLVHQLDNDRNFIDDLLDTQNELTNQIISRQDSYGKIYHFLLSLNTPYLDVFLMNVIQQLSEVFDTRTVRIYQAKTDPKHAQLQLTASRQDVQKSVQLDHLQTALDHIDENQIWVNHRLKEGYPMLMSVLTYQDKEPIYIMIENVSSDKMSLHYQNVFKVLTGLVQIAYQHVLFYNEKTQAERYLKKSDNLILNEQTFRHHLEFLEQIEIGNFKQRIFHIQAEDLQTRHRIVSLLKDKMALTDMLGTLNDNLYLVLSSHTGTSITDWEDYWTTHHIVANPVANLDDVLAKAQLLEEAI